MHMALGGADCPLEGVLGKLRHTLLPLFWAGLAVAPAGGGSRPCPQTADLEDPEGRWSPRELDYSSSLMGARVSLQPGLGGRGRGHHDPCPAGTTGLCGRVASPGTSAANSVTLTHITLYCHLSNHKG